jgi:hypothetical protein
MGFCSDIFLNESVFERKGSSPRSCDSLPFEREVREL